MPKPSTTVTVETQAETLSNATLLDQIMAETKLVPTQEGYQVARQGVSAFIAEILKSHDPDQLINKHRVDQMIAELDRVLSKQMDAILHEPASATATTALGGCARSGSAAIGCSISSMTPSRDWFAWSSTAVASVSGWCLPMTRWGGGLARRFIRGTIQNRVGGCCFTGKGCACCKKCRVGWLACMCMPLRTAMSRWHGSTVDRVAKRFTTFTPTWQVYQSS
ncbi:hypothetical protein C206_17754 [Pseudomonas putida TRO1]|uniref:Uncharacterized protein n=1 Tax=Pseudomonas putida TRO1 TaxID=1227924 RepID=A0AAD2W8V1_PSEPU|nr:hypothetical protein C206_17754 [Pseudomonas putida TRO1]